MHPNWKCLATVPLNYKTFVREGNKNPEHQKKVPQQIILSKHEIFTAETARNTYNSILSETYENPVMQKKKIKLSGKVEDKNSDIIFNINQFMKYATHNNLKQVETLLKKFPEKIDVLDNFGWSALMCAVQAGSEEVVEFLLRNGASTSIIDKSGNSALSLAIANKNNGIINALICKSPNKSSRNTKDNKKEFFCGPCNEVFKQSTEESHETSTLHLFNTKDANTRTYFGIPVSNKGYQLLIRNGWNQNTGLGPFEDGIKFPVKTVIRKGRTGLGINQPPARVTHTLPQKEIINANSKNHVQHHYNDKYKEKKFRSMLS